MKNNDIPGPEVRQHEFKESDYPSCFYCYQPRAAEIHRQPAAEETITEAELVSVAAIRGEDEASEVEYRASTSTAVPERIWIEFFDDNVRGASIYVPEWYDELESNVGDRLRKIKANGIEYVRTDAAPRLTPEQARERIRKVMREYYWRGEDGYIDEPLVDRIATELLRIDKEANRG